jgi:hypothetical protein
LQHLYMIDLLCDPDVQPFSMRMGMRPATGMLIRNYDRQAAIDGLHRLRVGHGAERTTIRSRVIYTLSDVQWLSNEEVVAARLGMLKSPEAA